jgi:hypothetical protein
MNCDIDILPLILNARKKRKGYATFFDWPNKATKEKGVVRALLDAMDAKGESHGIAHLKTSPVDPPDCIGVLTNGELVGFEVTELVDQKTVEMNPRGRGAWKEWPSSELIEKLKQIARKKDSKHFQGGPYSKIVLVIHTDEPMVRSADCDSILRGQVFGRCRQITEVYLLLSYAPGLKAYPYFRLEVAKPA